MEEIKNTEYIELVPQDLPIMIYNKHMTYKGPHINGIPHGIGVGENQNSKKKISGNWINGNV